MPVDIMKRLLCGKLSKKTGVVQTWLPVQFFLHYIYKSLTGRHLDGKSAYPLLALSILLVLFNPIQQALSILLVLFPPSK